LQRGKGGGGDAKERGRAKLGQRLCLAAREKRKKTNFGLKGGEVTEKRKAKAEKDGFSALSGKTPPVSE